MGYASGSRLAAIAAGASLFCAAPALAQSAADDAAMRQALQKQIDQLKTTIDQLSTRQAQSASPGQHSTGPASVSDEQVSGEPPTDNAATNDLAGGQDISGEPPTDNASTSDSAGSQEIAGEPPTDNAATGDAAGAQPLAEPGPQESLALGGAYTIGEQLTPELTSGQRDGGTGVLGIVALNVNGQYDKLTYAAEYRWSERAFANGSLLRYGWAAYDFTPTQEVKLGMFQVPFGNLRFGYQSFWGNLAYFAGFTDAQAAGVGYTYENGPLRFDVDVFKNDDLQQSSTYGSAPSQGYEQVNGGNMRLAYTFNPGTEHSVQISAAVRGGELEVGNRTSDYGTHWAATAAIDAALGNWTLQSQYIDYKYDVPDGRFFNGNPLPTDTITVENYGFGYQMPASGQMLTANIARTFNLDWGPVSAIQLYDNYGYLLVGGNGRFNGAAPGTAASPTGDVQFNAAGMNVSMGPLQVWLDVLSGKNSAMTFTGPNNNTWNTRYNLQMGVYFAGDVIGN